MGRYLSWFANAGLLVLCCYLVANAANAVFAALLAPTPTEAAPDAKPPAASARSWQDRQPILARNLFNASLLAPQQPVVVEEDLEASKLPLGLLGTLASSDPQLSWAAVEDRETGKYLVLQPEDELKGGQAQVMRIERMRLVLSENGTLRELTFDDDAGPGGAPRARRATGSAGRSAAARRRPTRRRPTPRATPQPEGLEEALRNPAQLFSQARILPKRTEDGEMMGLEVNAIKPGSLFEEIGIENGDVITELNGIKINSPEESARIMMEFAEATEFTITVQGSEGIETLNVTLPEQ
jgi:general secretion pathway protein C